MTESPPTLVTSGYAPVNGLQMYHEVHGGGGVPLLLLHGSLGSLEMFRPLLPTLTKGRRVIAIDQQGHGRTADVDRPLRYEQLADDAAAFLGFLGSNQVDLFGFSMGSAAAWQLAIRRPELVRKLVGAISYSNEGIYPEVLAGLQTTFNSEAFAGSPIETGYRRVAPNPDGFPALVRKVRDLTSTAGEWPVEAIRAIAAPTMIVIGDADIIRPEHAVELFRLRGGGVPGDFAPMPPAQLAILPGTTHLTLIERAEWLGSMIPAFLDAPMPERR
ncbi:MAG: alpha/beta hydrolase fold protein [Thermomicrobiales bacterium]|jgi:pimeloyl-ACP methyl ester carboxylesterase|nr:alpha/beta hydrolase fold protein [Thermomicrobiales bacterium]